MPRSGTDPAAAQTKATTRGRGEQKPPARRSKHQSFEGFLDTVCLVKRRTTHHPSRFHSLKERKLLYNHTYHRSHCRCDSTTMKVLLHYEDNENSDLYKSLKITLPKKWKTGPTQKLLDQFVETYNGAFANNQLNAAEMHLSVRKTMDGTSQMVDLPSDAVVVEVISDYADVYIQHGAAVSLATQKAQQDEEKRQRETLLATTVQCTHFGCKNRFPPGGPYPECRYHKAPPVFHETAKFWSCCSHKKAYDWETFQEIPGCQTGTCTEVKEPEQKQFLGGTDLREQLAGGAGEPLKSIDDFNKSQAAGGAEAAPVLDRLQSVMKELGVEQELYDQVVSGLQKEVVEKSGGGMSDAEVMETVKGELGSRLKAAMKSIAAEQLRIK